MTQNPPLDNQTMDCLLDGFLQTLRAFEVSSKIEHQIHESRLAELWPATEDEMNDDDFGVNFSPTKIDDWLEEKGLNMTLHQAIIPGNSIEQIPHHRIMVLRKTA